MRDIYSRIGDKLQNWDHARGQKFNRAVLTLEQIYLNAYKNRPVTWRQSFAATRQFILAHLLTFEFYFILLALLLVSVFSGLFFQSGQNLGLLMPLNTFIYGLIAGFMPLVLAAITFPLHVKYQVELWLLLAVSVIYSALLFSSLAPSLETVFFLPEAVSYKQRFAEVLLVYGLGASYLQIRIHSLVCFKCFIDRHEVNDLCSLIPADKRGQLSHFSAQDHYVEIVTRKGRHLNRMSMKDALAMVKKDKGMQVHRSHWVAYDALLALEKQSGRYFAILRNGAQVPVAKNKVEAVQSYFESLQIGAEFV